MRFRTLGEADNGQQTVVQVDQLSPDLVLMDVQMPVMDGVSATQVICEHFPKTKVMVLTTFDDDEYVSKAVQFGAIGYLLKDTPAEDLAQAIRAAHKGYTQLAPGLMTKVISQTPSPINQSVNQAQQLAELTPREREVLN